MRTCARGFAAIVGFTLFAGLLGRAQQFPAPAASPISIASAVSVAPEGSSATEDRSTSTDSMLVDSPPSDPVVAADAEGLAAAGAGSGKPKPPKKPVESDLTIEGMASFGNWKIFAAGTQCKLYTAGFEYDRHIWGHVIGSQIDYVAEVLPFVLLSEPAKADQYGNPRSRNQKLVPGAAFAPIGARFLWLSSKTIKPFFVVKGGAIGFTQKALSTRATYYDFTLQESIGVYIKMKEQWDLRLSLFGDFHFSNAYITDYNPGLDVMNAQMGLTYHFKNKS